MDSICNVCYRASLNPCNAAQVTTYDTFLDLLQLMVVFNKSFSIRFIVDNCLTYSTTVGVHGGLVHMYFIVLIIDHEEIL